MGLLVCEVAGWVWRVFLDPTNPGKRTLEPSKLLGFGHISWGLTKTGLRKAFNVFIYFCKSLRIPTW